MKKLFSLLIAVVIISIAVTPNVLARSYYKSAKTGKFTSAGYAKSHPSTTYRHR